MVSGGGGRVCSFVINNQENREIELSPQHYDSMAEVHSRRVVNVKQARPLLQALVKLSSEAAETRALVGLSLRR